MGIISLGSNLQICNHVISLAMKFPNHAPGWAFVDKIQMNKCH